MVDEAVLTGAKGYVAIHANGAGAPGPVIGVSALLAEGTSRRVKVRLIRPLTATNGVFVMLHLEGNGDALFDEESDRPAMVGGDIVVVNIRIFVN